MFGSARRRRGAALSGALVAVTMGPAAWAAPPQPDPMTPPALSIEHTGHSYRGSHPVDGDTFSVTTGAWSGLGNSYGYRWQRCASTAATFASTSKGRRRRPCEPTPCGGAGCARR